MLKDAYLLLIKDEQLRLIRCTICIITGNVMAGKSCNDLEEPETSVTVKNDCSEIGGYDCDFVKVTSR